MSTPGSSTPPTPSGRSPKLASSAFRLAPAALLGWALSVGVIVVTSTPRAEPLAIAFVAGTLGVWAWIGLAVSVLLGALLPQSEPATVGFERLSWIWLGGELVALAILFIALRAFTPQLVPDGLAYHEQIGTIAAAYGAWGLIAAGAWLGWRQRQRQRQQPRSFPYWTLAPLFLLARFVAADAVARVAPGRQLWLDWAMLGALSLSSLNLLPVKSRSAAGLTLGWLLSVGVLLAQYDARPSARADFNASFSGAAGMLRELSTLVDLDGDGVPGWLGGGDCDDADPRVSPFALELVGNGLDDNCMGGELAQVQEPLAGASQLGSTITDARSVVLITLDTVRADMLDADHMPALSRLAHDGAWFPACYAAAPYTADSVRTMMTGQPTMNVTLHFDQNLGAEPSLAEHLRAAGYETSLVVHRWWEGEFDWPAFAGFTHRRLAARDKTDGYRDVVGPQVTEQALLEVDRLIAGHKPFLLWIHYLDPHAEYVPRQGTPHSERTDAAGLYAQEVWATDRELGRVVERLTQKQFFDRGVLVVHSDHGELVEDEGRTGHARWLDEDVLRTLLVLRGAGVRPGKYPTRVRLLDVLPTVLELTTGRTVPGAGESLRPVWEGTSRQAREVIVYSSYEDTRQGAILQGPHKLVRNFVEGTEYLYDLERDPGERHNLIDTQAGRAAQLRERYGRVWDLSMNDRILARRARQHVEKLCAGGNAQACAALQRQPSAP